MAITRHLRTAAVSLLALAGAGASSAYSSSEALIPLAGARDGASMSYVVSWFYTAISRDPIEVDCPTGLAKAPDPADYLKGKELEELRANPALLRGWSSRRGPGGKNVCTEPWLEPNTTMPTGQSKNVNGMDLDGGKSHPGCGHSDLVAADGLVGADNQYGRVSSCIEQRRLPNGYLPFYSVGLMRDGEYTLLIQVSGVNDPRNDDDVTIVLTSSPDGITKSSDGKTVIYHASFTATDNPRYRHVFKGAIKDGVIQTSEAKDIVLPTSGARTRSLKGAQVRLHILDDGSLKGVMGAYMGFEQAYAGASTAGEQASGNYTCPGLWNAINKLADGYPDPKTGKCTAISVAYDLEAAPAFILAPPRQQTAKPSAGGSRGT